MTKQEECLSSPSNVVRMLNWCYESHSDILQGGVLALRLHKMSYSCGILCRLKTYKTSLINLWRACAARVTVLALCECLSVCYRSSSYSVCFRLQPMASAALS